MGKGRNSFQKYRTARRNSRIKGLSKVVDNRFASVVKTCVFTFTIVVLLAIFYLIYQEL